MLINPINVKETNNEKETQIAHNENKIIFEIIEYVLEKYQNVLSEIDKEHSKEKVEQIVKERIINYYGKENNKEEIMKKILDRFFGYYLLQYLIDDEEVSDIRTIDYKTVFSKRKGKWQKENICFESENDYLNFVRNCIIKNNGKINNETPIATVSDKENNLRIEAGISPVNVVAPNLVIRIHRRNKYNSLEELLLSNELMFDTKVYMFLSDAIIAGCNIVISGKGASGKTTLLRTLINKIPDEVAITSNEETAEIFSNHKNNIQREIIQNRKDKNIFLEDLSKECLVMSNDAIVVGELKGSETMTFIDSAFTGHMAYATVHANSAKNTIPRLVTLMKKDTKTIQYTTKYLEQILCSSIDIVIYMDRFRISEIIEIYYDYENERCIFNTLFKYENGYNKDYFIECNKPKYLVKEKIELSKYNIERNK